MPFGLKISHDVFQTRMDNITYGLPGMIFIHDDICIFGKTQQGHDETLLQLMKAASWNGLVFNSRKCHITEPKRITIILRINQLPSTISVRPWSQDHILGNKLAHGIGHHQKMYHFTGSNSGYATPYLKTTLAYYICTQPVQIHIDANEYGFGATLIQNNCPVAFASKTLTDVETQYANNEPE